MMTREQHAAELVTARRRIPPSEISEFLEDVAAEAGVELWVARALCRLDDAGLRQVVAGQHSVVPVDLTSEAIAEGWETIAIRSALHTLHGWLVHSGQDDALDRLREIIIRAPDTLDDVTLGELHDG